jgi:hypothetical protein
MRKSGKGAIVPRSEEDEAFLQTIVLPEERRRATYTRWCGGYRWFASSNVVALERYRSAVEWERICTAVFEKFKAKLRQKAE